MTILSDLFLFQLFLSENILRRLNAGLVLPRRILESHTSTSAFLCLLQAAVLTCHWAGAYKVMVRKLSSIYIEAIIAIAGMKGRRIENEQNAAATQRALLLD